MKRIILLLFVLLFAACASPDAKEPAQTPRPKESVETGSGTEKAAGSQKAKPAEKIAADEAAGIVPDAPVRPEPEKERFPGKFSDEPVLGERSYKSSTIDVTVSAYTVEDTYAKITSYYVADIYVKDVTSIKAAAARDFNTRYAGTVREISDSVGALLAIDGDNYSHASDSFLIRNGELYRSTLIEDTDLCVLYRDGRMETKKWGTFTMEEIIASDPWQVWGFGPALLDGNGHAMDVQCTKIGGYNPRAAIGYYEPGHYCFVVVDGRQKGWSEGVKLPALSRLMEDLGCKAAYNLDGGASAQMYWNGEIISRSSGEGRKISDIIYILPEA